MKKKNFWYNFDLYAQTFPLRFKKEKSYKSRIGLSFAIISIIIFVTLLIKGLITIFNRENFSIVEEIKYVDLPKTNFSNIPILIHLQNLDNGNDYTFNTSIFNISLTSNLYEYIDEEIQYSKENIPLVNCQSSIFLERYFDFYDFNLLNEYLCPLYNDNLFLEGDFSDSSTVHYLTLKISKCNNNNCINNIENIIDRIKLVFYIKINYPDYHIYKTPIKHYYKSYQIKLSDLQSKDISYYFYQKNFTTNDGLFFSNYRKYSLFDYESSEFEFLNYNDDYYFKARFYPTKKFINVHRNYKRLTEMLGETGGTCSIIFSILNLLTSYLLRNIITEDIINEVIDKNIAIKKNKMFPISKIKLDNVMSTDTFKNWTGNNKKLFSNNINSSNRLFIKNISNCSNSNQINLFYKDEKIKLKWYYHLFPLEYKSNSNEMQKLRRYKDFVFSSISLEKFFEIDEVNAILHKSILKLKNSIVPTKNKQNILNINCLSKIESENLTITKFKSSNDIHNSNFIKKSILKLK